MLLVTPTDAERLAFASAFATLSIAVRGPDDLVTGLVLHRSGRRPPASIWRPFSDGRTNERTV